ncbi:hypothetical protein [Succinimonas sp.]|uniref:hypothetical protein n=1 Tax=Succinimonas sp. TaxID=1936151 RepID=UPI003868940B
MPIMNKAIGRSWEEIEREIFTPDEIAAAELKASLVSEQIKARKDKNLIRKAPEEPGEVSGAPLLAKTPKFTDTHHHSQEQH